MCRNRKKYAGWIQNIAKAISEFSFARALTSFALGIHSRWLVRQEKFFHELAKM